MSKFLSCLEMSIAWYIKSYQTCRIGAKLGSMPEIREQIGGEMQTEGKLHTGDCRSFKYIQHYSTSAPKI